MKRIPLISLTMLLLVLIAAASAIAQSSDTSDNDASAALSIVETITTNAQVEITLNGQTHIITVPVTLNIDATRNLADSLLTAPATDRVGDLIWKIGSIVEHDAEYQLSRFETVTPSPGNKLVVITSHLTNLDSQPFTYWLKTSNRYAYDDLGNLYDEADYTCEDINPGETRTCVSVFDVPTTANILGVDVEVTDHKRLPFLGGAGE